MKKHRTHPLALALFLLGTAVLAGSRDETERNKAQVKKVFDEGLTQGRWDVFEEVHRKDFIAHAGKTRATLAEDLESAKEWRQAFPDLVMTVDQIVAEGDLVAVRFSGRGMNTGSGNGLPATGNYAEASGITIFRMVDGQIAEEWSVADQLGLLRQLGLLPGLGSVARPASLGTEGAPIAIPSPGGSKHQAFPRATARFAIRILYSSLATSCSSLYGGGPGFRRGAHGTGRERWWFLLVYCDRPNNVR